MYDTPLARTSATYIIDVVEQLSKHSTLVDDAGRRKALSVISYYIRAPYFSAICMLVTVGVVTRVKCALPCAYTHINTPDSYLEIRRPSQAQKRTRV